VTEELIETYRGAVYPWQCDHMGHMNVMWYVGKFDEATWNLFSSIGITPSFLRNGKRAMAAVQQNITYRRELVAGETVSIRSAVLEIRDKVLKWVHELRNAETGEISAVCVLTAVHIDAQTRKSCALPPEVIERGRANLRNYQFERSPS
jgi:acyl-CoA thioester hydrolase